MRILITGANGFIGGHLRDHLQQQHQVLAPARSLLDLTNSNNVEKFFAQTEVDVVIHCALIGRNNLNGIDDQITIGNLNMFANLYRNRSKFGRLINMGTGNEFDTVFDNTNVSEDTLFGRMPVASYGYAKNLIARTVMTTPNMVNMRLFGVFGNNEGPTRFFKRLKAATQPFHIFQDHVFDFIWVKDLFPIIDMLVSTNYTHQSINCVYPEKYRLSEMSRMFADIHGIDTDLIMVDSVSDINFSGNPTRLAACNLPLEGLLKGFRSYV